MQGDRLIAIDGRECVNARMRVLDTLLHGPINSVYFLFAALECTEVVVVVVVVLTCLQQLFCSTSKDNIYIYIYVTRPTGSVGDR